MKSSRLFFAACCCLFFTFASCGGGSGGDDDPEQQAIEETIVRAIEEIFGTEGHLWKPRADDISSGAGNLVVLLGTEFTTRFDTCKVPLNDGTMADLVCIDDQPWTQTPFSCFSNGNRQTWRANFTCDQAARVEVVCQDSEKQVVFTVGDGALGAVCSRFG